MPIRRKDRGSRRSSPNVLPDRSRRVLSPRSPISHGRQVCSTNGNGLLGFRHRLRGPLKRGEKMGTSASSKGPGGGVPLVPPWVPPIPPPPPAHSDDGAPEGSEGSDGEDGSDGQS